MEIEFSEHFWRRFEDRRKKAPIKITKEIVIQTIEKPDFTMPDPHDPSREWRVKKIQGYCLKVIVELGQDKIVAITLFLDRRLRRKGLCR